MSGRNYISPSMVSNTEKGQKYRREHWTNESLKKNSKFSKEEIEKKLEDLSKEKTASPSGRVLRKMLREKGVPFPFPLSCENMCGLLGIEYVRLIRFNKKNNDELHTSGSMKPVKSFAKNLESDSTLEFSSFYAMSKYFRIYIATLHQKMYDYGHIWFNGEEYEIWKDEQIQINEH